jgi:hypothetical protein
MTRPSTVPSLLLASLVFAASVAAQDIVEFPTAEEYAEAAAEAEAAPLFQSEEPLKITLTTDIKWLRDKRIDTMEVDGTVLFEDLDGSMAERPVEVRTRGNFRRDKRNCNFPPIRLDFPKKEMEGTVFDGQDKLKLVSPCHDSRDQYQRYVYKEYLVYKLHELISPMSFRVRLVEVTFVDINDDYDSRTKIGFLIEDEDQMAERNSATYVDVEEFHPGRMDGEMSVVASVFNYMIGNTDFSPVFFHNAKLIRTDDARYVPVPYDFDFAGAVNTRYATPDPSLSIRRVTDRLYRGFCRPELQYEPIRSLFGSQRQAVWDLYEGFTMMDENHREDALEFFEEFFEVMDDPDKFDREIARVCRDW